MPCWTRQLWPHNLNQTVSGKYGAVQIEINATLKTLRVTAEGAIALVIGVTVAVVILSLAVKFLTDWL